MMRLRWMMRKGNSLGLLPSLQRVRVGVGLGFVQKGESGGRPPQTARDLVRPGFEDTFSVSKDPRVAPRPTLGIAPRLLLLPFSLASSLPSHPVVRGRACVRACGLASPRFSVSVSVHSLTCLFPFLSALTMLLRQSLSTLILTMIAVVLWLWLRCSQSLFFAPLPVFAWPPLVERKESRRPPPPLENEFENTTTRRDLYTKREKKKRGIFRENKGGRKWGTRHVCGHSKNV